MKIIKETTSELVLKQNSYFAIVVGLIFSGAGFYLLLNQKDTKSLLLALAFIIIGLSTVVFVKFTTIILNKAGKTVSIVAVGLTGKKTQIINFDQIKEVSIEEYITTNTSNSGPRSRLNFNLVIYLNDGQGFPIAFDSPSMVSVSGMPIGGFGMRNNVIDMGNKISAFIGVTFVDRRPPTLKDVVSDVISSVQNNRPQVQINDGHQDANVKEGEVVEE